MAQIGSRLIDATAAKITDDFFKAFEAQLQARARRPPRAPRRCRPVDAGRAARARAGGDDRLGARGDRRVGDALPDPSVSAAPAARARSLRAAFGAATALTAALTGVALPLPARAQVAPTANEVAAYSGLHAAAQRGDVAAIAPPALPIAPALEARDARGRTPLHVATFARQREAIRALAAAGATLDVLENDRYDAVTIAAVADDAATLALLLVAGRQREARSPAATTAPR